MPVVELSNSLKKRFCSDFKLPINIFSEPYFSYYVNLYEADYQIAQKLEWFEQVLSKFSNQDDFFIYSEKLGKDVKELIANTQAYKNFNEADVNKLYPLEENVKQQNIYIQPNVDKKLISIDLQKANFNCLDLFDLKKEINADTYADLLGKFTNEPYYLESKKIRQVIFGDLNPSRQQRLQKYIINVFCKKLKEAGCILTSASSDEIIVQNPEMTPEKIREILKDVPEKFKFFRVEEFHFSRIAEGHDYFIKTTKNENGPDKVEFKNVPGHFFAQIYKKHLGLDVDEKDMVFYHEGLLAQFKEPLFEAKMGLGNNVGVEATKPKMK